jgi:hypothetical protein
MSLRTFHSFAFRENTQSDQPGSLGKRGGASKIQANCGAGANSLVDLQPGQH